jgi:CPA2 family monovalent cation:H+ antiporter-2
MLAQEKIPSLALDLDPVRVRDARDTGKPVVYGDAARRDVLQAAGLDRARAVAVSFNDAPIALSLRPSMPVIVRTMDDGDLERLMRAGATEVVPESLEGSLMMGSHLLLLLGASPERVDQHVREVRHHRYRMLREFFNRQVMLGHADRERLHSVTLPAEANAVSKRLGDLDLDVLGVAVSAVRQRGKPSHQPMTDTTFAPGDTLVLYGSPEALEQAEKVLLEG